MVRGMFLLLGCPSPEPPDAPEVQVSVDVSVLPATGWDPVYLSLYVDRGERGERHENAEPRVVSTDGVEVPMRAIGFHDYEHGWAAVDGFAPGSYLVTELDGFAIDPVGFEVSETGQVPSAFEVGEAWVLDDGWSPGGLGGLGVDAIWLEVLEVDDDDVLFRVVSAFSPQPCDLMTAWGQTDEDGHLTFLLPELIDANQEPPFQAWDIWFHVARSADGQEVEGVEAQAVIDTRRLDHADADTDLCDLLVGVAVACEPCPDGEEECLPVAMRAGHMSVAPPPEPDLPNCGADLSDPEDAELAFDWNLSLCSVTALPATLGPLAWLALILVRRRRAE